MKKKKCKQKTLNYHNNLSSRELKLHDSKILQIIKITFICKVHIENDHVHNLKTVSENTGNGLCGKCNLRSAQLKNIKSKIENQPCDSRTAGLRRSFGRIQAPRQAQRGNFVGASRRQKLLHCWCLAIECGSLADKCLSAKILLLSLVQQVPEKHMES